MATKGKTAPVQMEARELPKAPPSRLTPEEAAEYVQLTRMEKVLVEMTAEATGLQKAHAANRLRGVRSRLRKWEDAHPIEGLRAA